MKINYPRIFIALLLGIVLPNFGSRLNIRAEHDNNGPMPVWCITDSISFIITDDPRHTPITKDTKNLFLTDIIPIPMVVHDGIRINNVISIGDFFVFFGYSCYTIGLVLLPCYTIFLIYKFLKSPQKILKINNLE